MRILFCISSLSGGGAEKQLYYLSTELSMNGHDVHVFYIWDNSKINKDWSKVNLHHCNVQSNYNPIIIFQLLYLLYRYNFDIVQSWVVQMDIVVGIFKKVFNFNWIIRESSSSKNYKKSLKNRLRNYLSSNASNIVANSYSGKSYWESLSERRNVLVIPNGIPYHIMPNIIDKSNYYPLNFTEDYILYVGRIEDGGTANKNISKLILACDQLFELRNDIKLLIVGEGKDLHNLKTLVKSLNRSDSILFLGFVENTSIYKLMSNSSLFVSLSDFEGMPNTVLEALYYCKRILLSNIPEHKLLFVNPEMDDFVNTDNIEVIASCLNSKLSSDTKSDYYKGNCFPYSLDRMVNNYINLYLKISKNDISKF